MEVYPLKCGKDNYCYLLLSQGQAALVDASSDAELLPQLAQVGVVPDLLLLTHHHLDHVAGVAGLMRAFPKLRLLQPNFPPQHDRAEILTQDWIPFGGAEIQVLLTPFHTLTSACYLLDDALFTGDSLFVAGCGRLFEGTATQLWEAMCLFREMPSTTRVFTGHNYAEVNLGFAQSLEPENIDIQQRLEELVEAEDWAGAVSTIGQERLTNPFLRFQEPSILKWIDPKRELSEEERVFALRKKRNHF